MSSEQQLFILRGGSDLLRIAPSEATGDDANAEYQLLREHIASHGDRTLHFSAEVVEIIDATPTTRIVCVTDRALYKFPTSAVQSGLFFDARFPIEKLVQIVAVDNDDQLQGHGLQGLDAQVYVSSDSGATILAFILNFLSFPARRKLFFLSLSMVKPNIPILLKKRVSQVHEEEKQQQQQNEQTPTRQQQQQAGNNNSSARRGGGATSPTSGGKKIPHYMQTTQSRQRTNIGPSCTFGNNINASPMPFAPGSSRAVQQQQQPSSKASANQKYSPAKFRDNSDNNNNNNRALTSASPDNITTVNHSELGQTVLGSALPARELSADEFERGQRQLHVLLIHDLNPTSQLDMLDPGWRTAHRPAEEGIERINERDEIRAMIYAKEDKIELDARFREKNPKKALTKFARGVCLEFDKAHEERFVPPELSDEMLLGPALYPLWKQWKLSGGLLKVDRSGDDEDHQWTLFDTNDLISSIRAQEDALLGQIGKKSMFRLQQMRELVEREKKMFMNRKAARTRHGGSGSVKRGGRGSGNDSDDYDDGESENSSAYGGGGGYGRGKAPTTKPVPFRLSCSPNLERQVKRAKPESLDLGAVMRTMKDGLMVHRAKLHDLQKTQLVREINRHAGMK